MNLSRQLETKDAVRRSTCHQAFPDPRIRVRPIVENERTPHPVSINNESQAGKRGGAIMNSPVSPLAVSSEDLAQLNETIYRAVDTAVEAIEQAYVVRVSTKAISDHKTVEREYAAKAAAKVTIYETAVKAIALMSAAAADRKAPIAAMAIASIHHLCSN